MKAPADATDPLATAVSTSSPPAHFLHFIPKLALTFFTKEEEEGFV